MQIVRHSSDVPPSTKGGVVAIGNFDGVHLGHQALIARAKQVARGMAAPLGVLAFEPHPQEFFHPGAECFRLTPFRTKARLLAACGIDAMFAFPFDSGMAAMTAAEFIETILVESLGVAGVVVGADFRFGKGRSGDASWLAAAGRSHGFRVHVLDAVPSVVGGEKISSSEVRAALRNGRPEDARALLGHWWTVEGHVQRGDQRGRDLGYPTANMQLDGYLKPAYGIYAVRATIMENENALSSHLGVASLGTRPMYKTDIPLLETYLLDFSGDLYGKHLAVELIEYLRPEMMFDTVPALQAQMAIDATMARAALDRAGVRC